MQNTMQLLARALEQYTAAELARRVGVARQTFTDAKARGNLSAAPALQHSRTMRIFIIFIA